MEEAGILRRYTTLPSLIYMLAEKKLTLLDPNSWDDKNDSYFLQQYKLKRELKTVLALCFSAGPETYHHWSVFAGGSAGVCIQFRRPELLDALQGHEGVRHGEVNYLQIKDAESRRLEVQELPFTKRYPYLYEHEWRIVYESPTVETSSHDIPVAISCISRINLSPWLPDALKDHVKRTLWAIDGCADLDIFRSTLISNERWKRMGEEAV